MKEGETVGLLVRQAREARGLSQEDLAQELKLPLRHLQAIEADDWVSLPPGRPRPLARQLADRLGVDLEFHTGAFQIVPGALEPGPPDPRQERLERLVMAVLTGLSALVLVWLLVPGPRLGQRPGTQTQAAFGGLPLPPPQAPSASPYPVLGEMLPEAPLNDQGILVSLRALDACEVTLTPATPEGGPVQTRSLRVSEPWRLRVKGPFSLALGNAGVVNLEVAGRRIAHGQSVGEAWTGRFDGEGHWLQPPAPPSVGVPVTAPPPDDEEKEAPRP